MTMPPDKFKVEPASVLYFPSIEINNHQWLKSTLLLWDCVYRIVPSTYTPNDMHPVKVASDLGLVRPVTLEADDFSKISVEFSGFMEKLPFCPAGLDGKMTDRLHKEKIDSQLYPALERLARTIDPSGFLELPQDISRGYMLYLAKAVAGRRNLATVTDDRNAWTVFPYFKERGNFDEQTYNLEAQSYFSSLIFRDLLPLDMVNVEMEAVAEFVAKRKDERARLRNALTSAANQLAACESSGHVIEVKGKIIAEFEAAKRDFRKSMDFVSADVRHSIFTMGLPVSATVFGPLAVAGDPYSLINLSASVLLGAVAAHYDHKKVKRTNRRESDAAYLVDLDEELISQSKVPNYHYRFEEFVND